MLKSALRLFLPVIHNKWVSFKLVLESSLSSVWFDIIPLFSIPYAILLIQTKNHHDFFQFTLILFTVYFLLWAINLYTRKWDFHAKFEYQKYIEESYRKKIILKDNLAMDVLGTGKVQTLVQKGMHDWVDATWQILYQVPKVILSIVTGVYIMKDFGLAFIIFFFIYMIISSVGFTYFRKIHLKYDVKENEIEDEKNAHSVRVIMSRQEIIFSGKENEESKQLAAFSERQYAFAKVSAKSDFISDWFISGIGTILPFLGAMYVLNSDLKDTLNTAVFVSFIYFTSRFAFNMYSLLWIVRQTLEHMPKIQKFWDFLDFIPELKNYESGKAFTHGNGTVEFKNVTLEYNQNYLKNRFFEKEEVKELDKEDLPTDEKVLNKPILENFNLRIVGGSKLALVGMSGSGKTTIAKLIVGYLKATSGKVLVDGQDLSEVSLKSYYKTIGYLTQEPSVFDGSIKENMLYAISDKKDKSELENKITEALQKSGCDFVFKMKKGINTQIGEKGVRLSGGERQRLAIAKLFLKDPEIIILDEPTSALDSFSEEKISQSLEELFKGRTTIIIAHRLQTVRNADRILVIENGKVVEDGNHQTLVEQNGVYAQMLSMQSGF